MADFAVHLLMIKFILLSVKSGPLGHGEAFKPLESAVVIVWATVPLEKEPFVVVTVILIGDASVRHNERTINDGTIVIRVPQCNGRHEFNRARLFKEPRNCCLELLEHHRQRIPVDGEFRRLSFDGADQLGDLRLEVWQRLFQDLGLQLKAPTFRSDLPFEAESTAVALVEPIAVDEVVHVEGVSVEAEPFPVPAWARV